MRRLTEPSHLDLCCLQKPFIIDCGSETVKQLVKFVYLIEPFHLDLCCLQKPFIIDCGSETVKRLVKFVWLIL